MDRYSPRFYPKPPKNLHRYICHICDIMQLCCANSIMQKLIVFALLVSFSAQWETEIPSAIFSSAEKQAAWNYNLEIWHKFYGEKYPNEIFKEWIFWELLRINWIGFLRIRWRPFGVPAPPLSPWVNNPPNPEFEAAQNSNSNLSLSLLNGNNNI